MQVLDGLHSRIRKWGERRIGLYSALASSPNLMRSRKSGFETRVYDVLVNTSAGLNNLINKLFLSPSCSLCGSCCYFADGIGVPLARESLDDLYGFLSGSGLKVNEYVVKVDYNSLSEAERQAIKENGSSNFIEHLDGNEIVYYTSLGRKKIPDELSRALPKRLGVLGMWVTADSCSCKFMFHGRCSLHDSSFYPITCRRFLCLRGFTVCLMDFYGVSSRDDLSKKSLTDLNILSDQWLEIFFEKEYQGRDREFIENLVHLTGSYIHGKPLEDAYNGYKASLEKFELANENVLNLLRKSL